MYYIGIDAGKFNHCACVGDHNGHLMVNPFFFTNNHESFKVFLQNKKQFTSSRHISDLDAAGHYGNNLVNFLMDHKYEESIIIF